MAINFQNGGLRLEAPKFDYTNTPMSQAQNAAGLVNIANSFKTNQNNSPKWGTLAANGEANRIAEDAAWMTQAGNILGTKYAADKAEEINDMRLAAAISGAEDDARKSIFSSVGQIVGGGIGLVAGGPLGGAAGSRIGGTLGGMIG